MSDGPRRWRVRVWCVENGAEGEYVHTGANRIEAIEKSVEEFQENCAMAGAFYQPPRHRCQTEVLGGCE